LRHTRPSRGKKSLVIRKAEYVWTTVAYVIWPSGAQKLLEQSKPMNQPVDNFMGWESREGRLSSWVLLDDGDTDDTWSGGIVTQLDFTGDSDIKKSDGGDQGDDPTEYLAKKLQPVVPASLTASADVPTEMFSAASAEKHDGDDTGGDAEMSETIEAPANEVTTSAEGVVGDDAVGNCVTESTANVPVEASDAAEEDGEAGEDVDMAVAPEAPVDAPLEAHVEALDTNAVVVERTGGDTEAEVGGTVGKGDTPVSFDNPTQLAGA